MEEFHSAVQSVGGSGGGVKKLMESMGLGMIANQVTSVFNYKHFFILKLFKFNNVVFSKS